ncbi:TetR/AcrR family transcriptional regulator [Vulgatibacter sp.]|uniref:TetR/AcrR family transcriptional regulator n=1 Tax=Vulgatibacter sp. TaxID=1971226 RepID=UPI0035680E3E
MPPRGSDPDAAPGGDVPQATAPAPRIARKERRQADRRAAILDAARRVLEADGVAALTIAAVAAEADVSKPAVYYYFRSKEEVIGNLAASILEQEVLALEAAIDQAPSGVAALAALVRAKVDRYAADLATFRLAYVYPQWIGLQPALLAERIYPLSQRINDRLEQRLAADREAGRLHPSLHPRRLANLAWITAHGILSLAASLESVGGNTRASLEQLRDEAIALLHRAATSPADQ